MVLGRPAGHGRRGRAGRGGAGGGRTGGRPGSGPPSDRRPDQGRSAERPSRICDHLVQLCLHAGRDLPAAPSAAHPHRPERPRRMTAYADIAAHFGRIAALSNAIGILDWDNATMMPKGAAETRAESMALLQVLRHGMVTDPRLSDWLPEAEADNRLGEWERANLRE